MKLKFFQVSDTEHGGLYGVIQKIWSFLRREKTIRNKVYEVNVSDYIPYACHYDENTIVTKNGELMQIIKIVGFGSDESSDQENNLRYEIRKVVLDIISGNDNFAFWFSTLRTNRSLVKNQEFDYNFSEDVSAAWIKKNYWDDKFINELYISILYKGKKESILRNINNLVGFLPSKIFMTYIKFFQKTHTILDQTADRIVQALSIYNPRKLSIIEKDGQAFSEPVSFFSTISHLSEKMIPVSIVDLSHYIGINKMVVGNRAIEMMTNDGKRFATILSIKEYSTVSTKQLDNILQIPVKMIITQTCTNTSSKLAYKDFEYTNYILSLLPNNDKLQDFLGLKKDIDYEKKLFVDSQITIMVIANNLQKLNQDVGRVVGQIALIGLPCVREDLNLESCFWAQLPGNFHHTPRRKAMFADHIAGFSSLYDFAVGSLKSIWGAPITLLRTKEGNPYYFNFHVEERGNTLIISPYRDSVAITMHFLISQSMRSQHKLYYFNLQPNENVLIHALGGKEVVLSPNPAFCSYKVNPLILEDNQGNRKFILEWLGNVLWQSIDIIPTAHKAVLENLVDKIYSMEPAQRQICNLKPLLQEYNNEIVKVFLHHIELFCEDGPYFHLFNHAEDEFTKISNNVMNFVLADFDTEPIWLKAAIYRYFIHRVSMQINNQCAIIAVDKLTEMIDNPFISEIFIGFMGGVNKSGGILLASTRLNQNNANILSNFINQYCDTLIVFKDKQNKDLYSNVLALSKEEISEIEDESYINDLFLIKQGNKRVIAELNMAGIDHVVEILKGGPASFDIMRLSMFQGKGNITSNWLPVFYQVFSTET